MGEDIQNYCICRYVGMSRLLWTVDIWERRVVAVIIPVIPVKHVGCLSKLWDTKSLHYHWVDTINSRTKGLE